MSITSSNFHWYPETEDTVSTATTVKKSNVTISKMTANHRNQVERFLRGIRVEILAGFDEARVIATIRGAYPDAGLVTDDDILQIYMDVTASIAGSLGSLPSSLDVGENSDISDLARTTGNTGSVGDNSGLIGSNGSHSTAQCTNGSSTILSNTDEDNSNNGGENNPAEEESDKQKYGC